MCERERETHIYSRKFRGEFLRKIENLSSKNRNDLK